MPCMPGGGGALFEPEHSPSSFHLNSSSARKFRNKIERRIANSQQQPAASRREGQEEESSLNLESAGCWLIPGGRELPGWFIKFHFRLSVTIRANKTTTRQCFRESLPLRLFCSSSSVFSSGWLLWFYTQRPIPCTTRVVCLSSSPPPPAALYNLCAGNSLPRDCSWMVTGLFVAQAE